MSRKKEPKEEKAPQPREMRHDAGDESGPGDRVVCYYDGKPYSPGARSCQVSKAMRCKDDGTWEEIPNEEPC